MTIPLQKEHNCDFRMRKTFVLIIIHSIKPFLIIFRNLRNDRYNGVPNMSVYFRVHRIASLVIGHYIHYTHIFIQLFVSKCSSLV